jgi:hypothetical protein
MTHRLIKGAAACAAVAALCGFGAAGQAQEVQEVGVAIGPADVYVEGAPGYAPYIDAAYAYGGPRYRYGASHDIYGGPPSDLFSYEGPNRAAQERSR